MVRDLYETDYFSSENGRSLIQSLLGKKYQMSEDFKKLLRDNDNSIDKARIRNMVKILSAIGSITSPIID